MAEWQRWKGIMKAYPFEEKRLAKWEPPYIVQPKYDGVRCRAIPLTTGPTGYEYLLLSSEENIIYSVPHINQVLEKAKLRSELDGELYCHGCSFEEIVSITSRTQNIHPEFDKIKFHIFDIVNSEPQLKRTLLIENLRGIPSCEVAPFWLCENLDDVLYAFDKCIEMGYEGIIVRHKLNMYERKRSTLIMKFKPKQEDEYEIIGTAEEIDKDGNPKDRLGALVLKSGDGNIFNVGTGFSDEDRVNLWNVRGLISGGGYKALVKYQHITSGKQVPRFPVFVEVKADV